MKNFEEISHLLNAGIENIEWKKYPVGLYEPIAYTLLQGGKRIRPALALMACNLYSEDVAPAVFPALGIEIFHNFTLLHDDIMDKADIRRGQPTVHKKWDENTAILSGDVMQTIAYQYIGKTSEKYLKQILDLFSQTSTEIFEGQQYDINFEKRSDVNADEYLEMIRLKTAVLLGCALKTGAIVGGAGQKDAQLLYDFGINIGLAFQLKDDLLDVYGDEETFGKKIGGDILCNKKTYLLIHAAELAKGRDEEELKKWLSTNEPDAEKIVAVTNIYNRLGVKLICEKKMDELYAKAIECLNQVAVEDARKQELKKTAEKLMFRKN